MLVLRGVSAVKARCPRLSTRNADAKSLDVFDAFQLTFANIVSLTVYCCTRLIHRNADFFLDNCLHIGYIYLILTRYKHLRQHF